MNKTLVRDYLIELIGTCALVFLSAAIVCVAQMAAPRGQLAGMNPMSAHQPGLVGIVLAQAAAWTVLLALTVPFSGGYLNPAITLALWVFGKIDALKLFWLLGAQAVGAVLAGLLLRNSFDPEILREVRFATPHLNPLAYPGTRPLPWGMGIALEVGLTFFVVLAMFSSARESPWPAVLSGLALLAGGLVVWPLTGAAANPARWFGTCCWEAFLLEPTRGISPWADAAVYLAGPIVGSLLGVGIGLRVFRSER